MRRITPYLKPYWAWLPLLCVIAAMALYLVACLPPGGRFIYPLGRIVGTDVTAIGEPLFNWGAFLLSVFIFSGLPILAHNFKVARWAVLILALFLLGCCYPLYCYLVSVWSSTSRWHEADMLQTPEHRFYLADRYVDSGSRGAMLFLCDRDGFICELVGDDLLRDAAGNTIYNDSPPNELSLELDGNVVRVLSGRGGNDFTMPIP